jgi:hypothetical protein
MQFNTKFTKEKANTKATKSIFLVFPAYRQEGLYLTLCALC